MYPQLPQRPPWANSMQAPQPPGGGIQQRMPMMGGAMPGQMPGGAMPGQFMLGGGMPQQRLTSPAQQQYWQQLYALIAYLVAHYPPPA